MNRNSAPDFRPLRPADTLNLAFLFFLTLVTALFYRKIASPLLLITLYSGLFFLQIAAD